MTADVLKGKKFYEENSPDTIRGKRKLSGKFMLDSVIKLLFLYSPKVCQNVARR